MKKQLLISITVPQSALVRKTVAIFSRTIKERCGLATRVAKSGEGAIILGIDPKIGPEAYSLLTGPQGALLVTGGDERGLLYGIGRCLHTPPSLPNALPLAHGGESPAPPPPCVASISPRISTTTITMRRWLTSRDTSRNWHFGAVTRCRCGSICTIIPACRNPRPGA